MEGACAYEHNTVVNALTQGIQMAKHLRCNLNSAEEKEFLIHKILSSYENALFVLKSGEFSGKPSVSALPKPSLSVSPISTQSPQCGEFDFDQRLIYQHGQNVVSKKRKGFEVSEKAYMGKRPKRTCDDDAKCTAPQSPSSPEKYEIKPALYELAPPSPGEMLLNLGANLTINTTDFGATVPSSCSFPLTQFGFMEDYQQLHFPDNFDDELLQVYSPPFISPDTSESNHTTEWGS